MKDFMKQLDSSAKTAKNAQENSLSLPSLGYLSDRSSLYQNIQYHVIIYFT